jgi:hypothetical protein
MRKIVTIILIAIIAIIFGPRLVSTAYGQTNDAAGNSAIQVEAADPSAAPSAEFYGQAIGGVTPGTLFYVDASGNPGDVSLSLSITNTDELIHYLRYLTLNVAVYVEDGNGQWIKPQINGGQFPDTYLTLQNSPVTFTLPGAVRYKVTIDSGCFYCLFTGHAGDNLAPRFYLDAGPV